jgi:hypothetical protein
MTIQAHKYAASVILDRNLRPNNSTLSLQTQQMRGFLKSIPTRRYNEIINSCRSNLTCQFTRTFLNINGCGADSKHYNGKDWLDFVLFLTDVEAVSKSN